jgi:hypothetical protein
LENLQYVSVMTPPTATGVLTLTVQTYNVPTNLTLSYNITGLSPADTEISTSIKIYTQLVAGLSGSQVYLPAASGPDGSLDEYLVNSTLGSAVFFPNQPVVAMFDVQRTDHCVALTSQCEYDLNITTNTVGAIIPVAANPTPITLADAYTQGGFPLINCNTGATYSNTDIVSQLGYASARFLGYLDNNIIMTTYFYYDVTSGGPCIFVDKKPLTDFYVPSVKFKFSQRYPFNFPYPVDKDAFHVGSRDLGLIEYNHWQDMIDIQQPFDEGNELIIPYIAGYYHIPPIIKECIVEFMSFTNNNSSLVSSSIDGVANVYRSMPEILKGYIPFIRKYIMR